MAMDIEKQKETLQKLIEEYQHKIREYDYYKDDYLRLQHQQEGITQLYASYEFSTEMLNHNHDKDGFIQHVKHEIALKMVKELIEKQAITFRMEKNNDFDHFMGNTRLHGVFTYVRNN